MKKILLLAVALPLLVACAGSVRYSPSEIEGFPLDVQERIRNSEVTIGMTMLSVRYSWGAPSAVNILEGGKEEWIYRNLFSRTTLVFSDGKVSEIVTKEPGRTTGAKPVEQPPAK